MSIAAGSASEVEYQLLLACDLNYIQDKTYGELNQQVNEVRRMLNSFIKKPTAQVETVCGNYELNNRPRDSRCSLSLRAERNNLSWKVDNRQTALPPFQRAIFCLNNLLSCLGNPEAYIAFVFP